MIQMFQNMRHDAGLELILFHIEATQTKISQKERVTRLVISCAVCLCEPIKIYAANHLDYQIIYI